MTFHSRFYVTLPLGLGLLVSACSAPLPGKKDTELVSGDKPPTPSASDQNTDLSKLGDPELRLQVQNNLVEAKKQEAIRTAICAELQTIRNKGECQGLARLVEDSSVLSCLNTGSGTQTLKREFTVSAANAGSIRLSVNDGEFLSSAFNANGQFQPITWSNPGNLNKISPRLIDLSKVSIVDGGNQSVSLSSLQLKINGKDLNVRANGSEVDINAMKSSYTSGAQCRKSQADVDLVKQSASANASIDQAQKDSLAQMTREQLLQEAEAAKVRREVANSQILAVEKEMISDQDRGCWLDKSLETMKISVRGAMGTWASHCSPETAVSNMDYQITLDIGDVRVQRSAAGVVGKSDITFGTQFSAKKIRNLKQIRVGVAAASSTCTAFYVSGMDIKVDNRIIAKYDGVQLQFSGFNPASAQNWFDASTTAEYNEMKNQGGCSTAQ